MRTKSWRLRLRSVCLCFFSSGFGFNAAAQDSPADALYRTLQQRLQAGGRETVESGQVPAEALFARASAEAAGCPPVGVLLDVYNRLAAGTVTSSERQELERCLDAHQPAPASLNKNVVTADRAPSLQNLPAGHSLLLAHAGALWQQRSPESLEVSAATNHDRLLPSPLARRTSALPSQPAPRPPDSPVQKPSQELSNFPAPETVKSVLDLQIFKRTQKISDPQAGSVELVNLNEKVGAWYLLTINKPDGSAQNFNLDLPMNGDGSRGSLTLTENGILIRPPDASAASKVFALWRRDADHAFAAGADLSAEAIPYKSICEGALYLRNEYGTLDGKVPNFKARLVDKFKKETDSMSAFLHSFRATNWMFDKFKTVTGIADGSEKLTGEKSTQTASATGGPRPAETGPGVEAVAVAKTDLEVTLKNHDPLMQYGLWYEIAGHPGIYASLMTAGAASPAVRASFRDRVNDTESNQTIVYLTAFDLGRYGVGYKAAGDQKYPGWGISPNRNPALKGPDGIDEVKPLILNGVIPVEMRARLVSTFNAGYMNIDSEMRDGPLSGENRGSHWGVIENGVVLRRPSPGLATVVTFIDDKTELMTWPRDERDLLPRVRDLRQNSVAIIEGRDPSGTISVPGLGVGGKSYLRATWQSGATGDPRLRSGLCLQEGGGTRYLIYAYFTGAETSTMARVFQAYGCAYALQLDINSSRVSRLPLFTQSAQGELNVEYMHGNSDMIYWGKKMGGSANAPIPFVARSDSRDFFYVYRK